MRPHWLDNVPVSVKVFLAPGLTLCALLLLAAVAFLQLQEATRRVHDLSEGAFETFRLTAAAKGAASDVQVRLLDAILVSATEVDKARVAPRVVLAEEASARAHLRFDELGAWLGNATANSVALRQQLSDYLDSVAEVLRIARDDPASAWIIVNEVRQAFARLNDKLGHLQTEANDLRQVTSLKAIREANTAASVFLVVLLLTVGFSTAITLIAARSITRPIFRLTRAMSDLASGNLDAAVPELDRSDEVGSMAAAMQVFKEGLNREAKLRAESEIARERELRRFRQLADATFEGIIIHKRGRVLDVNAALCSLIGQRDATMLQGAHLLRFVTAETRQLARQMLRDLPKDAAELSIITPDGELPVEVFSRPFLYDQEEVVLTAVRDLSERKKAEAQILQLAFHDALTGLPNRYLLNDRLTQALNQASRADSQIAIFCLDLDRFKFVNDLLGHDSGDQLLKAVARRLMATIRASDTVARLGGDEFAIVQTSLEEPRQCVALAERVIAELAKPYMIGDQQVEISASIGIACYPDHGQTGQTLMKNGDIALYRAKAGGRDQYRFFSPEMDEQLRQRSSLEQDLRQAFARHDLTVHYQPVYDCVPSKLEGYEALLRWTHPVRGIVPPDVFIPAAEECGLIIPMGYWVLESACAEATTWREPWSVAVNLSAVQFRDPAILHNITAILERTGLSPSRLEIEVTESVFIGNQDAALVTLAQLRTLGIRISLDDFGTGYSSLSYLRRFPFDTLKIDKSFIKESETNPDAAAIVGAIVKLGHCLHMRVTGEGVETAAQLELLAQLHCHQAQGYLLGRPEPSDAIAHTRSRTSDHAADEPGEVKLDCLPA